MARIRKTPFSVKNLSTGMENESLWNTDLTSPVNNFNDMIEVGDVTSFLYFSDFRFNIEKKPHTFYKIKGLEIKLLRKGENVKDFWVDIMYPSEDGEDMCLTRDNQGSDNNWPFIYTDTKYGGVKYTWNKDWSLDHINSPELGVVVAIQSVGGSPYAEIKKVELVLNLYELRTRYNRKEIWEVKQEALLQ